MADCRLYVSPLPDDSEARDFWPPVNLQARQKSVRFPQKGAHCLSCPS
ncbi:hypothetical protein PL8927_280005 [Planktothrix serta PCC 8927]|uniref:Uncharacterized protein n=1 Tax=Planktothrix serta PCC 8927 TaxID=671068 RepID=A0A7Z9DW02_9CYAN|nr:hypothetical protein PL8927_280005 [Planktothrix serta PCC 8927]